MMAGFYDMNAAIQQPDYLGALREGQQYGMKLREQKRVLGEDAQMRDLATGIAAGDPDSIRRGAAINPERTDKVAGAADRVGLQALNAVDRLEELETSGKENEAKWFWETQIVPHFSQQFPNMPREWGDEAKRVAGAIRARTKGSVNPETNKSAIMQEYELYNTPEGKAFLADRNAGIAGRGGIKPIIWKDDSGRDAPMLLHPDGTIVNDKGQVVRGPTRDLGRYNTQAPGGGQARPLPQPQGRGALEAEDGSVMPTTQFIGSDGQPVALSDDLPPHLRQQILQQSQGFAAAPDGATAQLPQVNRQPGQMPSQVPSTAPVAIRGQGLTPAELTAQQTVGKGSIRPMTPEERKQWSVPEGAGAGINSLTGEPVLPPAVNQTGGNKPIPVKALQLQLEATEALSNAEAIDSKVDAAINNINDGTLDLGLMSNIANRAKLTFNSDDPKAVAYGDFMSDLEGFRNAILILHKGVQTEGDARRAMDEIVAHPNNEGYVLARLNKLKLLNERAKSLQNQKLRMIEAEYGGGESVTSEDGWSSEEID